MKVAGNPVPRSQHLLSVSVLSSANRIASARLVYQDGSASSGDFPLSNAGTFAPGAEIEILAGSGGDTATLFKGIIVRHSLKIREHSASQLIVGCRHKAVGLTIARKSAYYHDQSDRDILSSLLRNADLDGDIGPTPVTHAQMVQFDATDWDFLLLRAEANGMLVFTGIDGVAVKAPSLKGDPACTLQFGSIILEADLDLDARRQFSGIKVRSWDPANQQVVEVDAADPGLAQPGNLGAADLAAALALGEPRHGHPALPEEEARNWADAKWLYSQADRVRGSIKCEGIAGLEPGGLVRLDGVGERFNGKALITGLRHEFDLVQGWKTWLQVGGVDPLSGRDGRSHASPGQALLPGVQGLHIGVVVGNEDAAGEYRVRVRLPLVNPDGEGAWARVAMPDAGDGRGFAFRPEVGDEVAVGFLGNDPRQAIVLGMLHSSAKPAPLEPTDDNHEKGYQSRSKMKMMFDDDKVALTFSTPAGNSLSLSEDAGGLALEDENGNLIRMDAEGITIESAAALKLKAGTEIEIESGTAFKVTGGTEAKVEGSAGLELSSPAITKVKGSLVQIN